MLMTATIAAVLNVAGAHAAAGGRVYTLPFTVSCLARNQPAFAPRIVGAHAELTTPAAWRTLQVPAATGSGGGCTSPSLLSDRRTDGNECVQLNVIARASAVRSVSLSRFVTAGRPVIARGVLPTSSGMHGVWAEVDNGEEEPAYAVNAAYQATDGKLFYSVAVFPPQSYDHCPSDSASIARGVARAVAGSFRVAVTNRATAERSG